MSSNMRAENEQARVIQLSGRWRESKKSSLENAGNEVAVKELDTKTNTQPLSDSARGTDRMAGIARTMGRRLFSGIGGDVGVKLWDGSLLTIHDEGRAACTILFHCPHAFADMVIWQSPLRLAEDYFTGKIDIEGDIYQALALRRHFQALDLSISDKAKLLWQGLTIKLIDSARSSAAAFSWRKPLKQWFGLRGDRELNKSAIAYHYDVSNAFYRLWLDRRMVYSCAYFEEAEDTLDQAQANKLEHICRKLRLQSREKLLDVGCGWGSLMFWAAEHYHAQCHGITLSREQYEYVSFKIKEKGLEGRVSVEMRDYRDLNQPEVYDKAVSVGMFEHVGLKNMPLYFATVYKQLKPGGLFLNHGITADKGGWKKNMGTAFINKYVFPDGELERISTVQQIIEDANFEIHDVENLRPHYALTLREWVNRLQAGREEAVRYVPESVYRIWLLYMVGCADQFEAGKISIHQILVSKRKPYTHPLPLTRRDLYDG